MKKHILLLILGIVLFGLGGYQNIQYEEKAVVVDAEITDIKTEDIDDPGADYRHTYYGKYTVSGKEYSNKKLSTRYTNSYMPEFLRGDTIEIRVDSERPNKKVPEGGLFIVAGVVLIVYCSIVLYRNRKRRTE